MAEQRAEEAQMQYGVSYCGGEDIDGPMSREDAEGLIARCREHIADDDYDPKDYEPMALVRREFWPARWSEWREAPTAPADPQDAR